MNIWHAIYLDNNKYYTYLSLNMSSDMVYVFPPFQKKYFGGGSEFYLR